MKNIEELIRDKTIDKLEIRKVEGSKVELWSDGRYFGRQRVDIKNDSKDES